MLWVLDGDLTTMDVDAIVATDDPTGRMKGDSALAIRRAGGDEIEEESIGQGHHRVGTAWSTTAGSLPVRHVIHTATMRVELTTDERIIESALNEALRHADRLQVRTIAFPALGTGVSDFPIAQAARIMVQTTQGYFARTPSEITDVVFVLYGEDALKEFLNGLGHTGPAK